MRWDNERLMFPVWLSVASSCSCGDGRRLTCDMHYTCLKLLKLSFHVVKFSSRLLLIKEARDREISLRKARLRLEPGCSRKRAPDLRLYGCFWTATRLDDVRRDFRRPIEYRQRGRTIGGGYCQVGHGHPVRRGLATMLQSAGLPFLGSRLPLVQGVSCTAVVTMIAILGGGNGHQGVFGAIIAASVIVIFGTVAASGNSHSFHCQVRRQYEPRSCRIGFGNRHDPSCST